MSSSNDEKEQNDGFGWFGLGVAALAGVGIGALMSRNTTAEGPQCHALSSGTNTGSNSQSSEAFRNRPTPTCEPCGICLDNILVVVKLPCGHRFHEVCVKKWIIEKKNCPSCRFPTNLTQLKYSA